MGNTESQDERASKEGRTKFNDETLRKAEIRRHTRKKEETREINLKIFTN